MRSIGIVLTWEFWHKTRWWILSALMLMTSITIARGYYGGDSPPANETMARLHYRFIFHLFLFMAFITQSSMFDKKFNRMGFPAHLYIKPTETWKLVAWQMLFPAVTITLFYLAGVVCVQLLWGITWPLIGPLLFSITSLAFTQAVFWFLVGHPVLRGIACLLALAAINIWHFTRYGSIRGYPEVSNLAEMWSRLTAGEFLTLASCLVASYIVAVIGVSRDRCGECEGWPKLKFIVESAIMILPEREKPFNSPAAAQFWCEWKEKDWLFPGICGVWMSIIFLLGVFRVTDPIRTMILFMFTLQIGFIVPFLAGFIVGQCGRKSKIDDFKATLPVGDSKFTSMILKPGAVGLFSAFVVYVLAASAMVGWFFMMGKGSEIPREPFIAAKDFILEHGYGSTFMLCVTVIVIACGAMGLGASMTLVGRPRFLWIFWFSLCGFGPILIGLDILHSLNLIPFGIVPAIFSALPWIFGICFLTGTALAFFTARCRRLISSRILFLGPAIWIFLCIAVGSAWLSRGEPGLSTIVLLMGLLALTVAPLATAPLALAWNRHR